MRIIKQEERRVQLQHLPPGTVIEYDNYVLVLLKARDGICEALTAENNIRFVAELPYGQLSMLSGDTLVIPRPGAALYLNEDKK